MEGRHRGCKGFLYLTSSGSGQSCDSQKRGMSANYRFAQKRVLKGGVRGSCETFHLLGTQNLDFRWLSAFFFSSSCQYSNIPD